MGKRRDYSVSEKKTLLEKYDALEKMTQEEAALKLNVSQPFLNKLLKSRDKIQTAVLHNGDLNRKRNRKGKDPAVENALKNWFSVMRERDARVDGEILKDKAETLAKVMGRENFKATNGWFTRWQKRENLVYKKPQGEQREADHAGADVWIKEEWPKIVSEYNSSDIYNADETALYFRALPEHTYAFKCDKAKGVKINKERLTILCCVNMRGEKRDLFVIGKSKSPRCFKGVKKLPVQYDANKNAWMTAVIFNQWLEIWDKELGVSKRKIALLIDNCSAHKVNLNLTNIKVIFLPANTTSLIQPCDQGIINSLKVHYRRAMRERVIAQMESSETATANEFAKKTSLLDALHLLVAAWASVTETTIQNCFIKGGFCQGQVTPELSLPSPDDVTSQQFDEWICIDDNVQTSYEPTDEEICFG